MKPIYDILLMEPNRQYSLGCREIADTEYFFPKRHEDFSFITEVQCCSEGQWPEFLDKSEFGRVETKFYTESYYKAAFPFYERRPVYRRGAKNHVTVAVMSLGVDIEAFAAEHGATVLREEAFHDKQVADTKATLLFDDELRADAALRAVHALPRETFYRFAMFKEGSR